MEEKIIKLLTDCGWKCQRIRNTGTTWQVTINLSHNRTRRIDLPHGFDELDPIAADVHLICKVGALTSLPAVKCMRGYAKVDLTGVPKDAKRWFADALQRRGFTLPRLDPAKWQYCVVGQSEDGEKTYIRITDRRFVFVQYEADKRPFTAVLAWAERYFQQ